MFGIDVPDMATEKREQGTIWLQHAWLSPLLLCVLSLSAGCCPRFSDGEAWLPTFRIPLAKKDQLDSVRLRRSRNYYIVKRVEPYAHHFSASYHRIDWVYQGYAVTQDATGQSVLNVTFAAHGGGSPSSEPSGTPRALLNLEKAVRCKLKNRLWGISHLSVFYNGSHRRVELLELIPMSKPAASTEPQDCSYREITLYTDAALTTIFRVFEESGVQRCAEFLRPIRQELPPFIDVRSDKEREPRMAALLQGGAQTPFADSVLAELRRVAARQPGPALEDLAVHRDPELLPEFPPALGRPDCPNQPSILRRCSG